MNKNYCTRIFEPEYIYLQAKRQVGRAPELKAIIDAMSYNSLNNDNSCDIYPLKTFYYNYKRHIAVIINQKEDYRCQTFTDGLLGDSFDMISQADKAKAFFEKAKDELTVIDFYSGKELKPNYQNVKNYIEMEMQLENDLEAHNKLIKQYKERFEKLNNDSEVLYTVDPSCCYKSAMHLISETLETAEMLFNHKHMQAIGKLQSFLVCEPEYYSLVKMFGLYLYVINHGISNKRFLTRGTKGLAVNFNQTLGKMRKFIAENEGIVDKYIDFMQLTRNERENLIYLLSEEQLITDGNQFVGDELFA